MTPPNEREALQAEADMAWLYGRLAQFESNQKVAAVYRSLASTEEEHLKRMAGPLGLEGVALRPGWRARILGWIARHFGVRLVLPLLADLESAVAHGAASGKLARESLRHRETLEAIAGRSDGSHASLATLEGRHHAIGGNALRAAVLGANDGLVSNFCLVMGVAGATTQSSVLVFTGLAGLLAGAISMALGEWLSVQSSRELFSRQIEIEREELDACPEEEARELALIYQAKGLPPEEAQALADRFMANEATALDTLAREELGIDPDELGGSAWVAAVTSFLLFACSAVIPILPFFWLQGTSAVVVAAAVSGAALFLMGAAISVMTGRSLLFSGGRQMLIGLAAAAVTHGIGRLFGVMLHG